MKKLFLLLLVLLTANCSIQAQNTWTQKASYPATNVMTPSSFAINDKAYVFNNLGTTGNNSLYEFDPIANTWTQKVTLSGGAMSRSAAFSIGNTGYVATGSGSTNLYAYDPITDTWTAKASFPGIGRSGTIAFAIGNKGYVGSGAAGSVFQSDFYEYDPATDTWTQIASLPTGVRSDAGGFSVNGKGYLVGGRSTDTAYHNDLWEYDPTTNTWTQKASLPGPARIRPVGFGLNGKGYVGTGYDGVVRLDDFYEYNPATNAWQQRASYGAGLTHWATAFAANGKGYIGLGISSAGATWEYTPEVIVSAGQAITLCANAAPQQLTGTPAGGTWSGMGVSSSGLFTPSVAGTFTLIYSLPGGSDSTSATVVAAPQISMPVVHDLCQNSGPVTLTGSPAGGTWSGSGILPNGAFSPTTAGAYTFTYSVTQSGCSAADSVTLTVKPAPSAAFTYNQSGQSYTFSGPSGVTSWVWNFGDGNTSTLQNPSHTYTASGNYTISLTAIGTNGCQAATTQTVSVLVSANQALQKQPLKLYPNPASGTAFVTFTPKTSGTITLEAYDLTGRLARVLVQQTSQAGIEQTLNFSTDGLPQGTYLIRCATGVSASHATLVVK